MVEEDQRMGVYYESRELPGKPDVADSTNLCSTSLTDRKDCQLQNADDEQS
jgi:hypothetical protein